jgi:hypothetical protein
MIRGESPSAIFFMIDSCITLLTSPDSRYPLLTSCPVSQSVEISLLSWLKFDIHCLRTGWGLETASLLLIEGGAFSVSWRSVVPVMADTASDVSSSACL